MFRVLDPCSSLPPHGPQARVVHQSLLAHLLQPLFTEKVEASRRSLSLSDTRPALQRGLSLSRGKGQVGGSLTPTAPWVHRSLGLLSSLVSKLLCLLWNRERGGLPP